MRNCGFCVRLAATQEAAGSGCPPIQGRVIFDLRIGLVRRDDPVWVGCIAPDPHERSPVNGARALGRWIKNMKEFRTLVAFFSDTADTRRLATDIALDFGADLMEITEEAPRVGAAGYLKSLAESTFHIPAEIAPLTHDPLLYDLVLVGSPAWHGAVSSPVRAFFQKTADRLPYVGLFTTYPDLGGESALRQMAALCRRTPLACLSMPSEGLRVSDYVDGLMRFESSLRRKIELLSAMRADSMPSFWI